MSQKTGKAFGTYSAKRGMMIMEGAMKRRKFFSGDGWWGFVFLLPVMIGFLVFIAYPMIESFRLSFTDYAMREDYQYVGLNNYITAFTDDTARTVLKNTIIFTLCSVPVLMAVDVQRRVWYCKLFSGADWNHRTKLADQQALGADSRHCGEYLENPWLQYDAFSGGTSECTEYVL